MCRLARGQAHRHAPQRVAKIGTLVSLPAHEAHKILGQHVIAARVPRSGPHVNLVHTVGMVLDDA